MSDYVLVNDAYATVTPAGAFHAVTGDLNDPARNLLVALLGQPQTPRLDEAGILKMCPPDISDSPLELLYRMQTIGWIKGSPQPRSSPELNMERDVPPLLGKLSSEGKALLADAQGFHLAANGFVHEAVEEISALAADVYSIYQRHQFLVRNNLRINSSGWAAVNAAGDGQLGFWPLVISRQAFVLVVVGTPRFKEWDFADLIWWLVRRYIDNK